MKQVMQQERETVVIDELELIRQIQVDMDKRHFRNRRYDYYCGDWRYDWHEEQKTGQAD